MGGSVSHVLCVERTSVNRNGVLVQPSQASPATMRAAILIWRQRGPASAASLRAGSAQEAAWEIYAFSAKSARDANVTIVR